MIVSPTAKVVPSSGWEIVARGGTAPTVTVKRPKTKLRTYQEDA